MEHILSWTKKGIAQGREEGREQALKEAVLSLYERKFAVLPVRLRDRFDLLSAVQAKLILDSIFEIQKLSDLEALLDKLQPPSD